MSNIETLVEKIRDLDHHIRCCVDKGNAAAKAGNWALAECYDRHVAAGEEEMNQIIRDMRDLEHEEGLLSRRDTLRDQSAARQR